MESKSLTKGTGNTFGLISIAIPFIIFLLILNWFFKITPFQKYEGFSLLMAPPIGLIGMALGLMVLKKSSNKFVKIGVISNILLVVLPGIYMILGTSFFGV